MSGGQFRLLAPQGDAVDRAEHGRFTRSWPDLLSNAVGVDECVVPPAVFITSFGHHSDGSAVFAGAAALGDRQPARLGTLERRPLAEVELEHHLAVQQRRVKLQRLRVGAGRGVHTGLQVFAADAGAGDLHIPGRRDAEGIVGLLR